MIKDFGDDLDDPQRRCYSSSRWPAHIQVPHLCEGLNPHFPPEHPKLREPLFSLGEQTTVPWKGSNSSSEFGSVASSLLHSAQALAQSKAHREGLENHSCFLNEISSPLYHGLFSSHQFPNLLKSPQNKTGLDKVKRANNNLDIWITWASTFHFQKPAGLWVKWAVWKRNFSDWKRNCCCQQGGARHVFNTTPCWFLFPYFLYSQWGLYRGRFFPRSTQSTLARWAKDHFSSVFLKTTSFSL